MVRRHRVRYERPQQARYITCSCYRRLRLFNNDLIMDAFAAHIAACRERMKFMLLAWVIMPEHFHLILVPNLPESTVSDVLEEMKEPFARRVIARWRELDAPILRFIVDTRGDRHFWQRGGGYDRNTLNGHELYEKIRYIHDNPVRRGLVARAGDWRWSSARWYTPARCGLIPSMRSAEGDLRGAVV